MDDTIKFGDHHRLIKDFLFFVLDITINASVIIVLVLMIRAYVVAPFEVYGPSMCNTLNYYDFSCKQGPGEYILINKVIYHGLFGLYQSDPQRGDIVIFKEPIKQQEYYIKRIIGVPGDTIYLEDGFVYVKNDNMDKPIRLDERDYLNDLNFGNTKFFRQDLSEFTVPEDSYFVLGDNRTASADSRRLFSDMTSDDKNKAFIKKDTIIGKAWAIIWPFKNIRILEKTEYNLKTPYFH
ncbi:MAG: signal peptidase I, signal peptidase I [Candidatus Peregrinibacteria bacterium GW2011_GWF2_33_10]|nr:MAG: signal peptidase I, signal peptidase I [Candidatus Peregrinibacteria bacterium GW2011_GWF2_33_10]OGJ45335.1 MAG: signal peptidase I [Candidatus Peregrinibacteria bacterium RIFOXYA12_FULL_33_12]OGJ45373.1 MAG: signal peptidase I [Candidatus Peregrinibacteria bacterium RIFOXYA2_FULL_33_21]OGJ50976.1 MAG: signal peptidase I [Candidatus Peregrinibacteria bacterium RIFOXYB2_FULL_33_20]